MMQLVLIVLTKIKEAVAKDLDKRFEKPSGQFVGLIVMSH
jgi:hypothetical protein